MAEPPTKRPRTDSYHDPNNNQTSDLQEISTDTETNEYHIASNGNEDSHLEKQVTSNTTNQTNTIATTMQQLKSKINTLETNLSRADTFIRHILKEKETLRQENETLHQENETLRQDIKSLTTARADYEDGVDRCPFCGWEMGNGRCANLASCGRQNAESGMVSRIAC